MPQLVLWITLQMLCIYQITWFSCLKPLNVIHMSYQQGNCKWRTGNCLNPEKWFPDIFPIKSKLKLPQTLSVPSPVTLPIGRWWKNKKMRVWCCRKRKGSPSLQSLVCPWSRGEGNGEGNGKSRKDTSWELYKPELHPESVRDVP